MTPTFKILSLLLSYPTADVRAAAGAFDAALASDGLVSEAQRDTLRPLIGQLAQRDLIDLQERYVLLFDRTRSLSLHLFEHVHGESRDRGQAMVDLQALYTRGGLEISAHELPDFLPLFLEFLSTRPRGEALATLGHAHHVLAALAKRLRQRKSDYAAVFDALTAIGHDRPAGAAEADLAPVSDAGPDDFEALDREWEDAAVRFGPEPGGGCPKAAGMLDRMRNDPNPADSRPLRSQGA